MSDLRRTLLTLMIFAIGMGGLLAQEGGNIEGPKPPLLALLDSIQLARKEVEAQQKNLAEAVTEVAKAERSEDLQRAELRLEALRADFEGIATKIDVEDFGLRKREKIDLATDFQEAVRPVFEEFKQATQQMRAIEELRSDIEYQTERRNVAATALQNIDSAIAASGEPQVISALQELRLRWQESSQEAANRLSALQFQLEERESNKKSLFDTATDGFRKFCRTRGKNLLVTVLTFIIVFLVLRWLGQYLHRFSPWHRGGERSFYARLVEVLYHAFTFLGALMAAMLVLYASGDWVLLGLAILFLFGLVLAAKGGLPRFYEQARVLLNLGEVREGERVIFDGIPWRVEALGVFTTLNNPQLAGGEIRLPIRSLPDLHSRPYDEKEPWFPCDEGDWVVLGDGTRGKVLSQTPEMVNLVMLGGARKTYPTADFLTSTPEVLSRNFRVRSIFGLDYSLQGIATTEIPGVLQAAVTREILSQIDRDQLQRVKVEFRAAGSSSLDFEIIADVKGEVASQYEVIERALQKAAVDACNANGWTIPFPQLTLHRAELESDQLLEDQASETKDQKKAAHISGGGQ